MTDEFDVAGCWLGVDVAEIDIFEAFSLPDVVVVWNVDADGSSGAGKCNDVQTCEVWLQELVLLVDWVPRQFLNQIVSLNDKLVELSTDLLVNDGYKAFELGSCA